MGGGAQSPSGFTDDAAAGVRTESLSSDPDIVNVINEVLTSAVTPAAGKFPQLVYTKSKVYIHPTSYSRDNLPGWITIVKRGKGDYLLSWIPESLVRQEQRERYVKVEVDQDGSVQSADAAEDEDVLPSTLGNSQAWSVPLSAIYSLVVRPPTLANWYGRVHVYVTEAYLQNTENVGDNANNATASASIHVPTLPLFFHDDESPSTMFLMDRRSAALASRENDAGLAAVTAGGAGIGSGVGLGTRLPSSWGGENLIVALRKYANVVKSSLQPSLYLVNPSQSDLEVHSVPLFDDDPPDPRLQRRSQAQGTSHASTKPTSILHQSLSPQASASSSEALPSLDDLTFNVMASFSRLTNRAKKQAQSIAQPILAHPLSKPILKHLPPPIASLANADAPEYTSWADKAGVGGYDAARVYLARWARVVAEEGEKARKSEMSFTGGGLDQDGLASASSSSKGKGNAGVDNEIGGPFEVLATTYRIPRPRTTRAQSRQPIVLSEWNAWFDSETGKIQLTPEEAKKRIFQRGLSADDTVRKEAWPFLLNVYEWDTTSAEREAEYIRKKRKYEELRAAWFGKRDVTTTEDFIEEHHRIQIDCLRTDRTQPMFASHADAPIGSRQDLIDMQNAHMAESAIDPSLRGGDSGGHPPSNYHVQKMVEILLTYNVWETELGYVQGMSDLCSPLYVTLDGDETLVFWSFVNLMERRMKPNFYRDQSGMKRQLTVLQQLLAVMDPQLYQHLEKTDSLNLFFCFRWILIAFKREFKFEDTVAIWEAMWSAPTEKFHIFLALSILENHRGVIIRYLQEFDEVLKYINELSQTLDPQPLLSQAEVLYLGFRSLVEATDRRTATNAAQGPSSEGLRQRKVSPGPSKVKPTDDTDPLVKLVKDEADAEAKVPDLIISKELRELL